MIKPGGIWVIVPKQKKLFASGRNNDIIGTGKCLMYEYGRSCAARPRTITAEGEKYWISSRNAIAIRWPTS
jgi:hypothetical protein